MKPFLLAQVYELVWLAVMSQLQATLSQQAVAMRSDMEMEFQCVPSAGPENMVVVGKHLTLLLVVV